ncbi:MAG TPA: hypothetical protein VNJ04_17810 [Gemmatimonadaceae bacterium]|nr:hypothetical protein [Gemmatimonadaceae bacterium]
MSARGPEFEHALCNQVAIIVGYCELLLDEVPAESAIRADLVEMHKAALAAMQMLRPEGPAS